MFNVVLNELKVNIKNIKPKLNDIFGKPKFSWTQIRDTDSYSNSDIFSFDVSNQNLLIIYTNDP